MKNMLRGYQILFLLALSACSSSYQALNGEAENAIGYDERLAKNYAGQAYYILNYRGSTSDSNADVEKLWQKRAKELCPSGFKHHSFRVYRKYDSLQSADNGEMQILSTIRPVAHGEVYCLTAS